VRAMWTGAISFGLVNIPIKLYKASESERLDFDLLRREDQCRIRYVRVCGDTGEEVPYSDIVRGYQYEKGRYVILEDEDFEKANVRKTRTIEIMSFARAEEIDEKYIEQPYYLAPDEKAAQAYGLLREALKESKKVAIARFVLRTREHLAMLQAEGDIIVLHQMRFADEIRSPEELEVPREVQAEERQMKMALQLIDQLTEPWNPEQYRDTYVEDLLHIIEQKAQGQEIEAEEEPVPIEVVDLFAQLSQSLEMVREGREKKE
jgi:DNA end-binding protein Ku